MVEAAFYGDDFTGSTDALVQFERFGLRSVLLVELPGTQALQGLAARYDVIGVAGIARSLPPEQQEAELRPILTALRDLAPRVVQYKICSTADSSPSLGSLGRALELAREIFGPAVVPVLAAQPELGRYTVFGHHFAAEGGQVYRLDRQPTMANHPATPMTESDLRLHLAAQTQLRIGSIDLTAYGDLAARYADLAAHGGTQAVDVLVLDALTDADLHTAGAAILASGKQPLFAMGSGGLSRALASVLGDQRQAPGLSRSTAPEQRAAGQVEGGRRGVSRPPVGSADAVLVVSGSQSPRTADQIAHAVAAGWTSLLLEPGSQDAIGHAAVAAFDAGAHGVVVHTGRGNAQAATELLPALAESLAGVVRMVAHSTDVRRLLVAGGDTSGRVLRALGVRAVELVSPSPEFGPGAYLCRTIAPTPELDDLQILLKGGQIGPTNLFEHLRTG